MLKRVLVGEVMRLFGIYNRGYSLRYFIAENIEQALAMATQAGHTRRPAHFRKWVDLTDKPPEHLESSIARLLEEGRPGAIEQLPTGAWQFSA